MSDTSELGVVSSALREDGGFHTLPEKVADRLRERILVGDFEPGANIPERETSAEMGVSRTPLREALRTLAREGLVEIKPARSPVVADPSIEDLSQLFAVLRALEGLAGELACAQATAAEIRAMEDIHNRLETIDPASDPLMFFRLDMDYHKMIVASARNPSLIRTHQEYNARLWRARYLTSRHKPDRDRILHEHHEILLGIKAKDTRWTSTVLSTHLRTANRKIVEIYGQNAHRTE